MKISVLTPSYNQAKYLEQNILSVSSQSSCVCYEHIIMDGGSNDGSIEILHRYPHLIWRSEADRGQAHALNKALAIATGDVIGWVNSDDMLPPGTFEFIVEYFRKYPERHAVTGNLVVIDETSKSLYTIPADEVTYDGLLNGVECVIQTSTFFRRQVFDKVGNINESFHYGMDHELFLRISRYFKFYTVDRELGVFRIYKESKTGSSQINFVKDRIAIRKLHGGKLFSHANLMISYMLLTSPIKKISWFRRFVRKLKRAHPDFIHYP